jgi:hypothetical protein
MIVAVGFVFNGTVFAQAKGPGVVVLKGNPTGGVKFDHAKHSTANKCEICHHAAKPGKPMKAAQENCQDCHVKTPAAPMKTNAMNAFHTPMAKGGLCIDCHAKNAKGPKATPCTNCHKKENV